MRPIEANKALVLDVAVASGAQDSEVIDLEGFPLMGFIFPGTLTSTAMTFKTAKDKNGTFVTINNDAGTAISVTVAASKAVALTPTLLAQLGSFRYLKLTMGTAEGGARVIGVALKG